MISRGWHSGVVFGPMPPLAACGGNALRAGRCRFRGRPRNWRDPVLWADVSDVRIDGQAHASRACVHYATALPPPHFAASGYVGIKQVFERPYGGWLAVFGEGHRTYPEAIYAGLGQLWETERIAVKPYSAMGLLHAAIDAALELRSKDKVSADQIQHIEIDMPEAGDQHGGWKAVRPLEPIGAQMSVAYTVAVAILDGAVLIDQFSEKRINADDVWNLIDRTDVHHEASYDKLPVEDRLTTRVRLTLKDGSTVEKVIAHPRGTGDRQLSDADIVNKYRSLTRAVISPARQTAIADTVLNLEAVKDISDLMALLTPTVASALG